MKETIVNEYGQEMELTGKAYQMIAEEILAENPGELEEVIKEMGYSTEYLASLSTEEWKPISEKIAQRVYSRHFRN